MLLESWLVDPITKKLSCSCPVRELPCLWPTEQPKKQQKRQPKSRPQKAQSDRQKLGSSWTMCHGFHPVIRFVVVVLVLVVLIVAEVFVVLVVSC